MVTTQEFIEKGYLPNKIIPPFTTKTLADNLQSILNKLQNFSQITSRCSTYSIPKEKNSRRLFGIPNPLHQIKLCKVLSENWDELKKFISSSTISLSTPKEGTERALSPCKKFSEISYERAMNSTDSRYLLQTDISRYYSTIYTHSIPWALHGKEMAKANRGPDYIGNLIDTCVRNTMDGQTLGVPVGPDSSFIIAEIIGTAMDKEIHDKLGEVKGFRYIDDYYLYFSNLSEAETALYKLHSIMKKYELELNSNKTNIAQLPEPLEKTWVPELRLYSFHNNILKQKNDIISYFSKTFEFSKLYPNDSVLKYSLSRIKKMKVEENNWPLYESFILKLTIANPDVLPITCEILSTYKEYGYSLDLQKIKNTITQIITYGSKLHHSYEVSWALWLSKILKLKIDDKAAREISLLDNSLVALIALDLYHSKLIPKGLKLTLWKSFMTEKELYDEHWLIAYEASIKEWLPSKNGDDFVKNDPFFSTLKDCNVEFYDLGQKLEYIDLQPAESIPKGQEYGLGFGY